VCIDWWWYLVTCIDYLSMVKFIHYSYDCVGPGGPQGVLQCWMLSVARGSWVSQRSVVVAVWSL